LAEREPPHAGGPSLLLELREDSAERVGSLGDPLANSRDAQCRRPPAGRRASGSRVGPRAGARPLPHQARGRSAERRSAWRGGRPSRRNWIPERMARAGKQPCARRIDRMSRPWRPSGP
jgi:hypothetical protein